MVVKDVRRHRHANAFEGLATKAPRIWHGRNDMKGIFIRIFRGAVIIGTVFIGGFTADTPPSNWVSNGTVVSQAEAVIGRPATPGSYAGVARRTTRRTVRRHVY
jgi:hypothetical protein